MAYTPINWRDLPDKTTPVSAENLNHMDKGILDIDMVMGDKSKVVGIGDGTLAGAVVYHEEKIGECKQALNGLTLYPCTQNAYNEMSSHDKKTLYIITG